MKSIALKTLKQELSRWVETAASGEEILVTKYNRPFIRLVPGKETHGLIIGKKVGKPLSHSGLRNASKGQCLRVLEEDRDGIA